MDPVAALDAAGDAGSRPAGGAHRRRARARPGRARADRVDLRRGPPAPHHRPCAADRTGRCAGPRHRLVPLAPGSPTPRQDLPLRPPRSSALMIAIYNCSTNGHILATASGDSIDIDGNDSAAILWDITDPARPRRLSS